MRLYPFLLLGILLIAGCSPKTAGPATPDNDRGGERLKLNQVLRSIDDNRNAADWMDAKARVDLDSDKLSVGGTAVIRVHRDEAIWMSVKKFGFEGARALIRPDSFFLYNRLKDDYIAEPLSYIEEKYKIPARFDLLQEIFFGNAIFLTEKLTLDQSANAIRLTGKTRQFATEHLIDPITFQLLAMEMLELGQDRQLLVTNGDYERVTGARHTFPMMRTVNIDGGGKVGQASMELEFTDVEFGREVAMPFERR